MLEQKSRIQQLFLKNHGKDRLVLLKRCKNFIFDMVKKTKKMSNNVASFQ